MLKIDKLWVWSLRIFLIFFEPPKYDLSIFIAIFWTIWPPLFPKFQPTCPYSIDFDPECLLIFEKLWNNSAGKTKMPSFTIISSYIESGPSITFCRTAPFFVLVDPYTFTTIKKVWINKPKKRYGSTKTSLTVHTVFDR